MSETVTRWNDAERHRALVAWTWRTTAFWFIAPNFIVYYLKELDISDVGLGWANALPALAMVAQFAGSLWVERTRSRRALCVWLYTVRAVVWLPILFVGLWAAGDPSRYGVARAVFIAFMSLAAMLFHLHSPAWDSWFSDAVTDEKKGEFFGRWGFRVGMLGAVIGLAGGWLVNTLARGQGPRFFQVMMLLFFACNIGAALRATQLYRSLPDLPIHTERQSLWELLKVALASGNYLVFVGLYSLRVLALGVYAAFVIAWFKDDLGMTILFVGLLTAVYQAAMALVSPWWSRMVNRFGARAVLGAGLVLVALTPLVYFLYTPTNYWWVGPIHYGLMGLVSGAHDVSAITLWYALPGKRARATQFAVAWVSFGVAGAIGPMLGGWIATHAQPLAAGVFTWSRYHWLFLLSVALQLPALLLWQRLKVEGSQPPMMMVAWLLRRVTERRMG